MVGPTPPGPNPPNNNHKFLLAVSPDRGLPGTRHRFTSDRFQPGEQVVTWLNTPRGVQPNSQTAIADSGGRVSFELRSKGFAVGDYSFVAFGKSSGRTGVGAFRVQGPGGLAASDDAPSVVGLRSASEALSARPQQATLPAFGSGGIAGTVSTVGGGPVGGVPVFIVDANGDEVASAVSLPSGRYFVATGLPSGSYAVEAVPSLAADPALVGFVDTTIANIVVTEPNLTREANITLPRGATLSGTVADETGAGLPEVTVLVPGSGPVTDTAQLDEFALTDADGRYSTAALPVGSYILEFVPGFASSEGYLGRFSGGVANIGDAALVAISASGAATANVTLPRGAGR